ncbi:MAG TPA: thiamine diphosphokinase [Clostridia bacterium]|nr:thiamine diphosphokinase [Clostridia bacterium]
MRAVILTGGTFEDLTWLAGMIREDDDLICADSGAGYAAALGLVPRLVIGDFDSLEESLLLSLQQKGAVIKRHPAAKDDTDTALALAEAMAGNPEEIVILGGTGSRFDHTLGNVHLLREAWARGIPARLVTEYNEIRLVAPNQPAAVRGRPGQLFSLLPLTEEVRGVEVTGARWPLKDAVFTIGRPYGISNELVTEEARISVSSGLLLLVKVFKDR